MVIPTKKPVNDATISENILVRDTIFVLITPKYLTKFGIISSVHSLSLSHINF